MFFKLRSIFSENPTQFYATFEIFINKRGFYGIIEDRGSGKIFFRSIPSGIASPLGKTPAIK